MDEKISDELKALQAQIRKFVVERKWNPYHSPRNISVSLSLESAELLECFQWLNDSESFDIKNNPQKLAKVKDELADVFFCLLRLADLLDINLISSFKSKMKKNCEKYPIELAQGKIDKYKNLLNEHLNSNSKPSVN